MHAEFNAGNCVHAGIFFPCHRSTYNQSRDKEKPVSTKRRALTSGFAPDDQNSGSGRFAGAPGCASFDTVATPVENDQATSITLFCEPLVNTPVTWTW